MEWPVRVDRRWTAGDRRDRRLTAGRASGQLFRMTTGLSLSRCPLCRAPTAAARRSRVVSWFWWKSEEGAFFRRLVVNLRRPPAWPANGGTHRVWLWHPAPGGGQRPSLADYVRGLWHRVLEGSWGR